MLRFFSRNSSDYNVQTSPPYDKFIGAQDMKVYGLSGDKAPLILGLEPRQ